MPALWCLDFGIDVGTKGVDWSEYEPLAELAERLLSSPVLPQLRLAKLEIRV